MQWFSHITEIPQNKRKLLKREVSCQEVFFDQVSGYDNDIAVETIIESVLVCMVPIYTYREERNHNNLESVTEQCSYFTASQTKCVMCICMLKQLYRIVQNC